MALISWIKRPGPGRLGVMARPGRSAPLEDDLRRARDEGVDVVVSLITDTEVAKFRLEEEREIAERLGMKFKSFAIPDRNVPPADRGTMEFLNARLDELEKGRTVAVHCSSGRGRTSLVAASLLVLEGFDPDDAFKHVKGHRLTPIPDTDEQRAWVRALAENLGRRLAQSPSRSNLMPALLLAAVGVIGWAAYKRVKK